MSKPQIRVYTDGSGTTKDKCCGWGYVILVDDNFEVERSGHIAKGTNNVAELTAACEALENAELLLDKYESAEITLVSDSKLVLGYASGEYKIKAMHLWPLYCRIRQLHDKLNITCEWVKGHNGDTYNERADVLAKAGRLGEEI